MKDIWGLICMSGNMGRGVGRCVPGRRRCAARWRRTGGWWRCRSRWVCRRAPSRDSRSRPGRGPPTPPRRRWSTPGGSGGPGASWWDTALSPPATTGGWSAMPPNRYLSAQTDHFDGTDIDLIDCYHSLMSINWIADRWIGSETLRPLMDNNSMCLVWNCPRLNGAPVSNGGWNTQRSIEPLNLINRSTATLWISHEMDNSGWAGGC